MAWRRLFALLAGFAAGLVLAAGSQQADAADGGIAQLQRFVASTPTASGRFSQQLVKEGGQPGKAATGVFAYQKPGRFLWEIQKPYEQLIVTDGRKLSVYDKDLQQVTVKPVSEAMSSTPAALLFGSGEIDRSFRLADEGERDGLAWVSAEPLSKEAGFERLRIGLRDGLPVRMEVADAFGQTTRFEFSGIDSRSAIPSGRFQFTPPPGVDVVE